MPDEKVRKEFKMPREQYDALMQALETGYRLEMNPRKIAARYRDFDLAEQVPRVIMYVDIGILMGRIESYEAFLIAQGYKLRDPDEDEVMMVPVPAVE